MSGSDKVEFDNLRFSKENEALRKSISNIAVEAWRLERLLLRLLQNLDVKEQHRYSSKLRWFVKSISAALNEAGMRMVDYEGFPYDSGIPATPINLDDFSENDTLYISQMIEPVIVDKNGNIVHSGTISLQKN